MFGNHGSAQKLGMQGKWNRTLKTLDCILKQCVQLPIWLTTKQTGVLYNWRKRHSLSDWNWTENNPNTGYHWIFQKNHLHFFAWFSLSFWKHVFQNCPVWHDPLEQHQKHLQFHLVVRQTTQCSASKRPVFSCCVDLPALACNNCFKLIRLFARHV